MNSKNFLYLILGVGVVGAGGSSLVACSSIGDISRDDPDYSNYHVGTNYKDGRKVECNYKDATVIRQASGGFAKDVPESRPTALEPGLTATDRAGTLAAAKEKIIAQIEGRIRYERTFQQIESCDLECHEVVETNRYSDGVADASLAQDASAGSPINAPSLVDGNKGADQVSTTNNQVEGVDEADFIKNDNKYMYVLSGQDVKIIDAWPAASAKVISTTSISKGKPTKIFLGDNKLVVYSAIGGGNQRECTYGYDCVPRGDGSSTHVTVLNIADRTNPVVERELDLSGSLIAARKIGNAVHTVVYDPPAEERLQQLAYGGSNSYRDRTRCIDRRDDFDAIVRAYDEGVASRIEAVRNVSDAGPSIVDRGVQSEPTFRKSASSDGSYLTVASFGIAGDGITAETMAGKPGFVYAGSESLYISVPHDRSREQGWYNDWGNEAYASEVYKYVIGSAPTQTKFVASGMVKGTVLNQFAMDQWGGHLRIATTSGRAFDPKAHSTVTVMAQEGASLVRKGIVDNIAPTEDIRSVRFEGDRGFLVTFKKTDPLFAIDLANPNAPKLTGELKIPGFSTYMHFMDRNHILAIGLEADDKGSFAYFNGIQLQIFDVANMAEPKLMHKTVIGTRGTTSEALTNHLGFNYFGPKNMLALPMTICEGGGNGGYGSNMTFNGLLVYNVTTSGGFTKRGGIPHANQATCNNWWTNAGSTVERSVIMDDFVYSVARDMINVASVTDLANPVAQIKL